MNFLINLTVKVVANLVGFLRGKGVSMIKKLYKVCSILLVGFIGGCITPWFLGWFKAVKTSSASDAVAIANTYIVFTTIIFVGITVVLGIVGYVFTQQLAVSRKNHERQVFEELEQKIITDEATGVKLANAIFQNSDVARHLNTIVIQKIDEIAARKVAEAGIAAKQQAAIHEAMVDINSQLTSASPNGGQQS